MKSPRELAQKLARQWNYADTREKRLLNLESWPLELSIGKPAASLIKQDIGAIRQHRKEWQNQKIGNVIWEKIKFRDAQDAIELPILWQLSKPSEWADATGVVSIKQEFQKLSNIVAHVSTQFYSLLIRQRHLYADKSEKEVIQACHLAVELEQNCANGLPLRLLSLVGIDSKFFERHRSLIIKLLDVRFDGLISEIGLEEFLGSLKENDHWLLVADLDGGLIPFKQIRIRSCELCSTALSADNILIVENEQCLHLLPHSRSTIAILGAGLDLIWMDADWLREKKIGYWGDIDTWGLTMLGMARQYQPGLSPLMMNDRVFQKYSFKTVSEPQTAGDKVPDGLNGEEAQLYKKLIKEKCGRLEQEFIESCLVGKEVSDWVIT